MKLSKNLTLKEVVKSIKKNLEWDQMIWEFGDDESPAWIHVSFKEGGKNRKQIKRAYRDSNGVYYKVV